MDSVVVDLGALSVVALSQSPMENQYQMPELVLSDEVERLVTDTLLGKRDEGEFPGWNHVLRYLGALSVTQMAALRNL